MQQPIHEWLAVWTNNYIDPHRRLTQRTIKTAISINQPRLTSVFCNDRPAAFNDSTDLSFPQRSSSCIQQLDRPQLPATIIQLHPTTRPTSATSNDHLAASLRLYQLPTSPIKLKTNTTATDFTHALVNTSINCHLCYICYLAFVSSIVFGCHYSHAST